MGSIQPPTTEVVMLSDLLGALSIAADLANGNPQETCLRICLVAVRIARETDASQAQVQDVYYTSLLRYIGCTAYAHEEAQYGDDISIRHGFATVDFTRPRSVLSETLRRVGKGAGFARRLGAITRLSLRGSQAYSDMVRANCDAAAMLARRLRLGDGVVDGVSNAFERWDGKGGPRGALGEQIPVAARITHVANAVEVHRLIDGVDGARAAVTEGAGTQFDPEIARVFQRIADDVVFELDQTSVWGLVVPCEPPPRVTFTSELLDDMLEGFAEFVDLQSVFTLGHSRSVAKLARAAGAQLNLSDRLCQRLERAALVHDLGRVSVPTSIWEKPGELSPVEWDRVRLHPFYTEAVLSKSSALRDLAALAGSHHERIDGTGYHRGSASATISQSARILAAADVYSALIESRAHRPAHGAEAARKLLRQEATEGRLDASAVDAVLAAAGHRWRDRMSWPRGLSDREVEVLRWVARGYTNKQIARQLSISPRTVQHHVVHVYAKIGVSSRAGAALFAMKHDLLSE